MARLFFVLSLLAALAPSPLIAQGTESLATRMADARQAVSEFRRELETIPKDTHKSRHLLPEPFPKAVRLAERIEAFLKKNSEIAPARAARETLFRAHDRNQDVAGEIAARRFALTLPLSDDEKFAEREKIAELEARSGAHLSALKILQELTKEKALPSRAAHRNEWKEAWTKARKSSAAQARRFEADLIKPNSKPGPRLLLVANRFTRAFPRHEKTPTFSARILAGLAENAPSERLAIADRLGFHRPDSKEGLAAMRSAWPALVQSGDYERADLYLARLQKRGDGAARNARRQLAPILARIAARKLDLTRNTKRTRTVDLEQRFSRRDEALETLDRARAFREDYRTAPESKSLLFRAARAALHSDGEEAREVLKSLLAEGGRWPERNEAISLIRQSSLEDEGRDSWIAFLEKQGTLSRDPALALDLDLERARLLGQQDREEEGIELLRNRLGGEVSPTDRSRIESEIAGLEARLGG